ncbi:MAG: ATP-binding protein [Nitrospirota bacterium]
MVKTLYAKLAAVFLGIFCLMGILYVLVTLFTTRMYLQEVNQKLNRGLAKNLVSETNLLEKGRVNDAALKEIFHMLMVINPNIEIYLLDAEGRILAYSAPPGTVKRERVALAPLRRFAAETGVFPILGDDPRDLQRQKVFSVCPIPKEGGPIEGYLYVILGGEAFDSAAQMLQGSYILRLSAWAVAGGLLFALLAGLLLFHRLTRRLARLDSAMERFMRRDFSGSLEFEPSSNARLADEIDRLGATFTRMADRILDQLNHLKQTDRLRRELVANVSHDLRTPLASLQGYLETLLLKEGTLSTEEQRRYLEIASTHSVRLGKLVAELFELAKLDSQEAAPHVESFSLGELAQDVAQKFQLPAQQRRIRLEADVRPDLPFISADIGLIERVFENLIDNALRHTPAGGTVTIALAPSDTSITVRVADTGQGIPPEALPHIFDRFYKVETGAPSEGAGLGLAIAKRILELHGSSIEASSAPNAGTTFTFRLPISAEAAAQ